MASSNRIIRLVWNLFWFFLFRPSPSFLHGWRRLLLRLFGAKLAAGTKIYPSVKVWAPWNLEMKRDSCLGPGVNCYSMAKVSVGAYCTVSQYSHLCSAGHDIYDLHFKLTTAPIHLGDNSWVAADAFVGPGVTIGEGAVVGARACVFKDVKSWSIVGGNPAKVIGKRTIRRGH